MIRFLYVLFSLFPLLLTAQLESWNGLAFEYEASSKWAYILETEYRWPFKQPAEGSNLVLLGANRSLAKNLSITAGTRFQPGRDGDATTFRLFTDLNYKYPLGKTPFTLEGRLRCQQDRPLGEDGSLRRAAIRPRLGLATELHERFTIVAEYEGRFRFDSRNEWSRNRITIACEFVLTDRMNLELFYREERRVNQAAIAPVEKIVGLYLDYTLPSQKHKGEKLRHPFGRKIN